MANIDTDAIVTRVREIMTTTTGISRAIPADRFQGALPDGVADAEASRRGVVAPRYDVRVRELKVHPSSPPSLHPLVLYELGIDVVVMRHVDVQESVVDATRDTAETLMMQDADVITQAMTYHNNLFATNGGTLTGLVSGCLKYLDSEITRTAASNEAGVLEAVHHYTGIVSVDR